MYCSFMYASNYTFHRAPLLNPSNKAEITEVPYHLHRHVLIMLFCSLTLATMLDTIRPIGRSGHHIS